MPDSTQFDWRPVNQTRLHHSVDDAIAMVRATPKPVVQMSLEGWVVGQHDGRYYVRRPGNPPNFFHPHKLGAIPDHIFPVLVGTLRGGQFLLDGSHRVAKWIQAHRATISAIILSEAETKSCIRPGLEKRVDEIDLDPPL